MPQCFHEARFFPAGKGGVLCPFCFCAGGAAGKPRPDPNVQAAHRTGHQPGQPAALPHLIQQVQLACCTAPIASLPSSSVALCILLLDPLSQAWVSPYALVVHSALSRSALWAHSQLAMSLWPDCCGSCSWHHTGSDNLLPGCWSQCSCLTFVCSHNNQFPLQTCWRSVLVCLSAVETWKLRDQCLASMKTLQKHSSELL